MTTNTNISVLIIAAGQGTRMKTNRPKIIHKIAGREMVNIVVDSSKALQPNNLVAVVADNMKSVEESISKNYPAAKFAIQYNRNGTATAVKDGMMVLGATNDKVIILYGDTPFVSLETMQSMIAKMDEDKDNPHALVMMGFNTKDINLRYGRFIVDNHRNLKRIVEYKEASEEEKSIPLCNAGILVADGRILPELLAEVNNNNSKSEYYLTDIVEIADKKGLRCGYVEADEDEVMGINSQEELSVAEEIMQNKLRKKFMTNGVTLVDPKSVHFCYDTEIEHDVTIHPCVVFGKGVKVKSGAEIKPFSYLENRVIS